MIPRDGWNRRRTLVVIVLGLVAAASPNQYNDDVHSANEAARLHGAMAIVDHGNIRLDSVWDDEYPGWREGHILPNVDVAVKDGRYLLDKAPGVSLLTVPLVALLRATNAHVSYRWQIWGLALLFAAVPSVLYLLRFRRWLVENLGPGETAVLVAPALVLATPWLLFGSQYVSHALAASLVGWGLMIALGRLNTGDEDETHPARAGFLGGLVLGIATVVEYPCGILAVVACAALLADRGRRRRLPWVILGGLGPAILVFGWNTLLFGGPFEFPYGYKATPAMAEAHAQGLYGIAWPRPDRLYGLLLSARRGLLFLAPWLAVGLVGAFTICRDRTIAVAWRVVLPVGLLSVLLAIAGFQDWHGGRTLGPRYILPVMPVIGIAAALAIQRLARRPRSHLVLAGLAGLAASSLLVTLVAHVGYPLIHEGIANPLYEVVLPVLAAGGPIRSAWDPLIPAPFGTIVTVLAALVLVDRMIAWHRRESAGVSHSEAGRPRMALSITILVAAFVLHQALLPIPRTGPPGGRVAVLEDRGVAHWLQGQEEAERAIMRELGRPFHPGPFRKR